MDKTMIKFKLEGIKRDIATTTDRNVRRFGTFCRENPIVAVALIGAVGTVSGKAITGIARYAVTSKELRAEDLLRNTVYDPSTHLRYHLRRTLSNSEALRVDELKAAGMTLGQALKEINAI